MTKFSKKFLIDFLSIFLENAQKSFGIQEVFLFHFYSTSPPGTPCSLRSTPSCTKLEQIRPWHASLGNCG